VERAERVRPTDLEIGGPHSLRSFDPPYQSNHAAADASDGIRQSPRGLSVIVPTFGPSGSTLRLYWLAKNRFRNTPSHRFTSAGAYSRWNFACFARNTIFSGGAP